MLNSSHFFHVAPGNPSSFVVALAPGEALLPSPHPQSSLFTAMPCHSTIGAAQSALSSFAHAHYHHCSSELSGCCDCEWMTVSRFGPLLLCFPTSVVPIRAAASPCVGLPIAGTLALLYAWLPVGCFIFSILVSCVLGLQMRGLGRANNYFRDLLLPPPRARAFMHHASHARGTAALNRLGECYSFSTQDSAYLLPHEAGFDERLHEPPPILEANEPGRPHMYAPVVPTSKKYKGPKKEVIRTPVDVPESLRNSVKATWSLHDIVHTVTAPTPHPPTVHRYGTAYYLLPDIVISVILVPPARLHSFLLSFLWRLRVNSLVPDSSYLFRVRALSAAGWSPWSEISDRLRTTQGTIECFPSRMSLSWPVLPVSSVCTNSRGPGGCGTGCRARDCASTS